MGWIIAFSRHRGEIRKTFHAPQKLLNKVAAKPLTTLISGHLNPLQHTLANICIQFANSSSDDFPGLIVLHSQPQRRIVYGSSA